MVNTGVPAILGTVSPLILRLRDLRLAAGMTQETLARAVGTRVATISVLENNKSRRITLDMLDRLATALGVEVGAMFGYGDTPRRHR